MYKLQVQIVSVKPTDVESIVTLDSMDIESVSQISAEDRARRYFRRMEVAMKEVEREVISETEAVWTGHAESLPEVKVKVRKAKTSAPKTTPEQVFDGMLETLTDTFDSWKAQNGDGDWARYQEFVKGKVEVVLGVKFVSLTNRPFQLKFLLEKVEHTIGRGRNNNFELKS